MSVIKEKFIYGDGDEYYLDVEDVSGYSFSRVRVYIKKPCRFLWIKWFRYERICKDGSYTISTNSDSSSLKSCLSKIFEDHNSVRNDSEYLKNWDRTFGVTDEKKKQLLRNSGIDEILE